jgi:hypothetical protein
MVDYRSIVVHWDLPTGFVADCCCFCFNHLLSSGVGVLFHSLTCLLCVEEQSFAQVYRFTVTVKTQASPELIKYVETSPLQTKVNVTGLQSGITYVITLSMVFIEQ